MKCSGMHKAVTRSNTSKMMSASKRDQTAGGGRQKSLNEVFAAQEISFTLGIMLHGR